MRSRSFLLTCALTCRLSQPGTVSAQSSFPLNWENIFSRDYGALEAALSPDGRWVAVAANTTEGLAIHRVSTEGGAAETWVRGSSPSWSPDSRRIVFRDEADLWIAELGSKERKRLTADSEDERAPVFSPDGSKVAFYSTRSGYQDIWLVDAGGTRPPVQLTRQAMTLDDGRFAPSWSADGRSIAFVSNASDFWEDDLWLVDVASGKARELSRSFMASSSPVWSPDGQRIAVLGTAKNEYWYEDLSSIYVIDPRKHTEEILKMQVYATDWLHTLGLFWSGDASRLTFIYHERGDLNVWSVGSRGGVATRITNMGGAVRSFHATARGDAFVLVRSTPTRGNDVDYITDLGGEPRRLTHFSPEWDSLQEPREVAYRSFDGLYIQGFLYLPRDFSPESRYPALVNVHGGGTNSYLRRLNLIEQILASKGYMVLAINYRGGSGFGREFQDLSVADWANGQAKDAAAAATFLRNLPTCNGKVGIYGYSYGGIMTMATIARAPEAFDAAVPMAGIYDFADAYRNADRVGKIFIKTGHRGSPEERPEVYAVSHTLARLEAVRTPLLIMHGEEDVRAPFRQYRLAVDALTRLGKVFESKSYPGEPHGFRDLGNRVDMYRRLEAFFEKYLRS